MSNTLRQISRLLLLALTASASALAAGPYPHTDNFGVPFSTDEDWYKQCMRAEHLHPAPSAARMPADCKPIDLYDRKRGQAVTSQAEWDQVRACALAKNDNAVLMMLYANGYGVLQDSSRAIHHACMLDFIAKSEMEHRIAHLADGPVGDRPFDLCDDITSGYMGAVCASRFESNNGRVREARLDRAARTLSIASQGKFATLRQAAAAYAEAGAAEVDFQGTGAPASAIQRQARLCEEFMQAALDAIAGKLPLASPDDFAARDAELNQVYREVMEAPSAQAEWPDRIGSLTVAHADVRKTERLWLAYRDAFAAFAANLPAGRDSAAVTTLLTTQRLDLLQKLARWH
jgi:uncharacterized protein YecT (DUF1311 family)